MFAARQLSLEKDKEGRSGSILSVYGVVPIQSRSNGNECSLLPLPHPFPTNSSAYAPPHPTLTSAPLSYPFLSVYQPSPPHPRPHPITAPIVSAFQRTRALRAGRR